MPKKDQTAPTTAPVTASPAMPSLEDILNGKVQLTSEMVEKLQAITKTESERLRKEQEKKMGSAIGTLCDTLEVSKEQRETLVDTIKKTLEGIKLVSFEFPTDGLQAVCRHIVNECPYILDPKKKGVQVDVMTSQGEYSLVIRPKIVREKKADK